MHPILVIVVLVGSCCSFVVSSSVGLGGSLLMVPIFVLAVGPKEGVALAALLLASNNVFKLLAYRATIPWRAAIAIAVATVLGAAFGARLLLDVPAIVVVVAVLLMFAMTLSFERASFEPGQYFAGPGLALVSGATSGFSGTSGPLKGAAIRNLGLDRLHFVGAASLVSFSGDATKVLVFADGELLGRSEFLLALTVLPLMILGTWIGRRINRRAGERLFAAMFWTVMAGYSLRLVTTVA